MRKALLTGEVALTVVLLVAAGLLFRSFLRLRGVDLGCTTKNVLTMNYFLRGDKYSKPEQIVNFDTQLLDRVRDLPGVEAAGITNVVPGDGYYGDHEFWIPEHPPQPPGEHHFAAYRRPIQTISQHFKFRWSEDVSFLRMSDWSTTNI